MANNKSKWICSLSNGETYDEAKPIGDLKRSPWLNLVDYIISFNEGLQEGQKPLEVRHIKAIVNGIVFNTPTFGAVGHFENEGNCGARQLWVARRQSFTYGQSCGKMNKGYIDISYSDGVARHHLVIDDDTCESWQTVSDLEKGTQKFISFHCKGKWH